MKTVRCLSCGAPIDVGERPRLFQTLVCPACHQNFVIIEIYPMEICFPLEERVSDSDFGDQEETEDQEPYLW